MSGYVILFIFVLVFILALVLLFLYLHRITKVNPTETSSPFIATNCLPLSSNNTCGDNLICDPATYTCKVPNGNSCTSFADCLVGSFCSGICTSETPGKIGGPCPCGPGLVCSQNPSQENSLICLIQEGKTCTVNEECESQVCNGGICQGSLQIGQECTSNSACGSNFCSPDSTGKSFCQNPSTPSGSEGSNCSLAECGSGLTCFQDVCVIATKTLGDKCNSNNFCVSPLLCETGNCYYPQNPNTCTNNCIDGFTCSSEICTGNSGQGCINNGTCSSGVCNLGNPAITLLSPTNLLSQPVAVLPSGMTANNIYVITESEADIIYVNTNNDGLIRFASTWTIILGTTFVYTGISPVAPSGTYSFITSASLNPSLLVVGEMNNSFYLFTASSSGINLDPFNDGIQKDMNGNPLTIYRINADTDGNILLTDNSGNLYLKSSNQTNYTYLGVNTTVGKFFSTNTPSYINSLTIGSCNLGNVVIVSQTKFFPNVTSCMTFNIIDYDSQNGSIISVGSDSITNEYSFYVGDFKVPTYADSNSRVAVGSLGYYIYSAGSCL